MNRTLYVVLSIVLLIIGLVGGYFWGLTAAPVTVKTFTVPTTVTVAPGAAPPATLTVTAPPATITAPGAAPTLSGEIPIGVTIPLTGVLSTFGAQFRVVAEKAADEINAYLASLGRPWRIKLIIEDTATDPKTALDKVMALHARGVKVFIGIASSAEVAEVKQYADANKLLVISPSSTSPALAIPDMILRYTANDLYQGKAIAKILWVRGVRYVAFMWRGDTWGDGLKKATEDNFNKICQAAGGGCGVLQGVRYDPKAVEFSVEVSRLASIVQDAVNKYGKDKVGVELISFEEAKGIFAAAKAYPILGEVVWQGSDGTAGISPLLDPAVADFVVKVKFFNTIETAGVSPYTEKIKKWVRDALGQEPLSYTYFVYDALWTVALAIDLIGKYDGEAIKNAIYLVLPHYIGASGFIQLDENGDRVLADYDIWAVVYKDGKYSWEIVGLYKGLTDSVEWYK